jgi:ribosome-binding protein aMBF1 (putative translation factor)
MATDLSDLELPALVEHMQDALAHVRQRLTQPGTLAPAVRRARENTDLSRDAFAKRVGVCDSTIRNVETARHTCMPKVRNGIVQALANLGQFPQALSGSV